MTVNRLDSGQRDSKGRFVLGNKNGGRPRVAIALKDQCRAFVEAEGWERLVAIARGDVPLESSLSALRLVLEYGYGKPQQHVDLTSGGQALIQAFAAEDLALLELPEPK